MSEFTIGQVAKRTGLATSAIRYYESAGIVPPPSRVNGRRIYSEAWMKWLGVVLLAQKAGFSNEEIRRLVAGFPKLSSPSSLWKNATEKKVREIDHQLEQLYEIKDILKMMANCQCSSLEACGASAINGKPGPKVIPVKPYRPSKPRC